MKETGTAQIAPSVAGEPTGASYTYASAEDLVESTLLKVVNQTASDYLGRRQWTAIDIKVAVEAYIAFKNNRTVAQ